MPKHEVDPEDPMELVGVELPAGSEEGLREMALTFAEEFIRSGFSEEQILGLFKSPFYQGPYLAWRAKGEAYVNGIIQEARQMWRPVKSFGSEWRNGGQSPKRGLSPKREQVSQREERHE